MTLELWLIAGAVIIVLFVAGAVIGMAVFSIGLDRWHAERRRDALAEQAEAHKLEMRELASYNARLEQRVSELEAQLAVMFQALKDARIPVPKTAPLSPQAVNVTNVLAGAGLTTGGDIAGRDKMTK